MKAFWNKAEKLTENIENKTLRFSAFCGALTALFLSVPTIFAAMYGVYNIAYSIYHLNETTEVVRYLVHQVGQNTRKTDAEHDLKTSFGVPVRMSNPPLKNGKPVGQGDLWYTTYTLIEGKWYIVTYKAAPNMTDSNVDIFNYNNEWEKAGEELKPAKKDIKAN